MTFDDWEEWDDAPRPVVEPAMTAQDIAEAVVKQPPEDPVRFAKLARLVQSQAKLEEVIALLPESLRAKIAAGMRGRVK